nr:integrase, catalytic region, zinc finger, CCHC-type, peptidase aspartic, catalytic [Tanacetum cinerariifolium]
ENYKNLSQDIRDQLHAEAEAVQIILTGIDNNIYSTVDACPNACEDGESLKSYYLRFYKMMNELVRNQCDSQELKTVSYHKLYDILKQHQNEVNEIRAERITRNANPLALVAQQQPVYHPQNHPTHYTQNSSTRSQQAATRNRGKAIVNSPQPIYDQEPAMVAEDDEMSKDKEINKLMALISLSFKKIYKPTNNNLRTSSNTSRENQDNSPRINRCAGYDNQRECQKPKRGKDAAYHREKMLLCKQKEAGIQLNAEQADWRDDTDDESSTLYVSNDDHYNVFSIKSDHPEQSESVNDTYLIEQDEHNMIIDSLDMSYDNEQIDQNDDDLANERELLASLIEKLKYEIDDNKNRNKFLETSDKVLVEKLKEMKKELCAHQETISILSQAKETQNKLYKTREDKELDKVIALENKVKVLDNIVYKTGQSVQTMNMLNSKCKTSFAKPEFIKKAQRANPRLYDIGCYNDNFALMLAPESDEDLKAQLQDKAIVISELKKLIENLKGKSVDTKFEKSSVIRQPNAFKSQRPSILGKPTIFSDSLERKYFSKSKSVTKNNVSNYFSKPITAPILPPNKKSILKTPRMYKLYTEPTQTRTLQLPYDSRKTNKRVSFSIGVIPTTSVSRPKLKSNPMEDRVMLNNSQRKKQKVEDHRRNVKFSNNKTSITACNDSLNAKTSNVNFVCVTYGKCVLNDNHDMCVLHYLNGMNSRTKIPWLCQLVLENPNAPSTNLLQHPLGEQLIQNPLTRNLDTQLGSYMRRCSTVSNTPLSSNSFAARRDNHIHVDSGCSKHMTENLKLLTNFVEKFLGTVKFGNDQVAPVLGYGDLVQGTVTIKRVYYVKGLNHNLFFVGQFCDADLKVAFRKSTCYIRDLKGNDLLTGSRGTYLYFITL